MTVHLTYRDATGAHFDASDSWDVTTLDVEEKAEEASVGQSTVPLDDPAAAQDMGGHRRVMVIDDDDETGGAIYWGYSGDRSFAGTDGVSAQGRTITGTIFDVNSRLARRVLTGVDCVRPAETDVERIAWVITTDEAYLTLWDTSLVSSADPVDMDATSYEGQTLDAVIRDCMEQSGKNAYLTHDWASDIVLFWYGAADLATYDSGCALSNDPAEIDEVTTFAISDDATATRDPSRVYSGVYLTYSPTDGSAGYVYVTDPGVGSAFAERDVVYSAPNVHTSATATARANRFLATVATESERVVTRFWVSAAKVNAIRPGHLVTFRATHLPAFATARSCRVISRQVRWWAEGQYEISVDLSPVDEFVGAVTTLVATNTVMEDGGRTGIVDGGTTDPGKRYAWTITVTQHSATAATDILRILTATPTTTLWHVETNQGGTSSWSGTFTVPGGVDPASQFRLEGHADYGGAATVDEQWTLRLVRLA